MKTSFSTADLLCLLMTLVWGANMSITKHALDELSPMAFNGARMLIAPLLLWMIARRVEGPLLPRSGEIRRLLLLGFVGNTLYQLFFIFGLAWTKAGNVALILSFGTVLTALMSRVLGHERMNRMVWTGILASLIGVLMILYESAELGFGGPTLKGDLMILGAAACWSFYTVFSRPEMQRYSPLRLTTLSLTAGGSIFTLFSAPAVLRAPWGEVSMLTFGELAYSSVLSIALGYLIWFSAIHRIGSTRTAIYGNLIPFTGLMFASLVLNEPVTLLQIAGGVMILFGIFLTRLGRPPDAPGAIRPKQF
jgi:drug/metabolite transporter (DMT)-like permease